MKRFVLAGVIGALFGLAASMYSPAASASVRAGTLNQLTAKTITATHKPGGGSCFDCVATYTCGRGDWLRCTVEAGADCQVWGVCLD